jgi:hypothetical protein
MKIYVNVLLPSGTNDSFMRRKRLEKASAESLNLTLSRMLGPEYIFANVDIYGSQEYPDSWVMELREKEGHIPS